MTPTELLRHTMQTTTITTPRGAFGTYQFGARHAPVVIALHGFPDTARSWRPVGERLAAQGFHVVAPYLRGYAPSPLDGPFDVDALADDLAAIVATISPGAPVVLVGHDWGSVIAYIALLRHPTLFRVAVTLAVPHPLAFLKSLPRTPSQVLRSSYMALFQIPRVAEAIVTRNDFAFIDTLWQRWSPGYVLPPDERRALKDCLAASMPGPLGPYRTLAWPPQAALQRIAHARSGRIGVPTLHLQGDQDGCIAVAACVGEERFFSAAFERRVLAGVGHFAPLEAPDAVANAIVDWTTRHGAL